jgi:hypothetical protein
MTNSRTKSIKRLVTAIVVDLLVLGVFLGAFAYFYFLRVPDYTPKALSSPTQPAASATPTADTGTEASASPDGQTATPEPVVNTGLLGRKYADKFTAGDVEQTGNAYRSANVSIEVTQKIVGTEDRPVIYYLADIYVKDISSFRTAVAFDYKDQNAGSRKNVMPALQLSQIVNAIVSISGDNFASHDSIVVRNGIEWEQKLPVYGDICVLYYDGTMETYPEPISKDTLNAIYDKNPFQIWTFGPELLENGQIPSSFANSKANPLCSIGYFEPGHYCFILVDGRQPDYSWGMSHSELAQVFYDLGCKAAFNLDGGDTAVMTFAGAWRSKPENLKPRDTSDILYICEPAASGNGQ